MRVELSVRIRGPVSADKCASRPPALDGRFGCESRTSRGLADGPAQGDDRSGWKFNIKNSSEDGADHTFAEAGSEKPRS